MNLRVTTLAKNGTLAGRSRFGAFTGNWSTGRSQVRSNKLVPSTSTCGEMRELEEADGSDGSSAGNACGEERHRADAGGKAGSVLVPQQTWSRFGLLGTALDVGQRHTLVPEHFLHPLEETFILGRRFGLEAWAGAQLFQHGSFLLA